jgi:ribose transport system substrate-binding protein
MTTTEAPSSTTTSASTTTNPAGEPPRSSRTARRLIVFLVLLIALMFLGYQAGMFKPRPKVALVTASEGAYWDLIIKGAQHAAERHKVNLAIVPSKGDEPTQTQAIRNLIGKGFDGVAVSPNDPPRQAAALAEIAAEANLVTFDSDSNVSRRLCFIGTDNYDAGRMAGQQIRQAVPDGGDIVLCIGSLEKENGQRRRQGVIDELLERTFEPQRPMDPVDAPIKEPRSKYTVAATIVDGINQAHATQLAKEALTKYPNAKCFAGLFAYNTPAILTALKETGKLGQVQVVGFDTYEETLAGIESGHVAATIMQDPFNIGYESVRVLADAARGERHALPLFQQFYLACDAVKKENLAQTRADLARKQSGQPPVAHASTSAPPAAPATQPQPTTQQAAATSQ